MMNSFTIPVDGNTLAQSSTYIRGGPIPLKELIDLFVDVIVAQH